MQKDEYDEYDGESQDDGDDDDDVAPVITSNPETKVVKPGASVLLPCDIEGTFDSYVVVWEINDKIIFQDRLILSGFDANKYELMENKSMVINNINEDDETDYTCKIMIKNEAPKVTHKVILAKAPIITSLIAEKNVQEYKSGDTLNLTCIASGLPKPKIIWSLKGKTFSSQDKTLIIENIKHADSGSYQCLADNSIGQPAHQSLTIQVMHKPIVSIQKLPSNIGEDSYDIDLKCVVHSTPGAIVEWRKNGVKLDNKIRIKNNFHILTLAQVKESDFGTYTCHAVNQVGENEQHISLMNTPSKPVYLEGSRDEKAKDVNLIFDVESIFPITEYTLYYKKHSDEKWMEEKPVVHEAEGNVFKIKQTLYLPEGSFEVKVKAKNMHGWSEESKVLHFKTKKSHHQHQHKHHNTSPEEAHETMPKESPVKESQSTSTSSEPKMPMATLVCLMFASILFRY
ncbi:PREDICTED: neurotrimin-like [Nicrophorus vespilloides]|uniref:Neurotrimin-like n=1 Tax=Nicrophorus vespilloides TaxID=110193 RepID=A0ABM1MB09_NICVS|nr:PREDICTED: neurotrimin-like [Nicrophorus vespilloides]